MKKAERQIYIEGEEIILVEINRSGAGDNKCLLCIKNIQEGLKSEDIESSGIHLGQLQTEKSV